MLLQNPRHHLIHDPKNHSAILIIESHANGSANPPSIHCLSRAGNSEITTHPGQILGSGESKLMITRVRPGVIIETMEHRHAGDLDLERHYSVGPELEVIPVASGNGMLAGDHLLSIRLPSHRLPVPDTGTGISDNELVALFGNQLLPSWVMSVLDRQLEYWNVHHLENYYRYMPGRPIGPEFARCIKAAPFWALARWKDDLFPGQRSYCMRRSPAGAVAFCIERIPPARRPHLLARNPEAALRHGFHRLNEKELAICVTAEPAMAMAMARGFTPASRARLLGTVVKHCTPGLPYRPNALLAAILDSITEAPESWLQNFEGSFITAFETLDRNLKIRPSGETLLAISKRLPPDKQAPLLEVVADWI